MKTLHAPRLALIAFLLSLSLTGRAAAASKSSEAEVSAARALFERNLDAIRRRDLQAYLACYLQSAQLVRSGPTGTLLGFEEFKKSAGEKWPDEFEASDLRLVSVQPGIVYGSYRYRVRYGDAEQAGLSERLFVKTPTNWRIAMTSAFPAPSGMPPPPLALVGGTLVDGTGTPPLPKATVLVRDGKIECAGQDCEVPEGVRRIDAAGTWITPGLVDAHVHFSQTGWADGRPDALDLRDRHPYEKTSADLKNHPERIFRSQLCSGVTAVFDVGGYPWTIAMAHQTDRGASSPHVAAAGPLLSTIDFWLNLPAERQFIHLKDEESARVGARYLASIGADAVKIWYIVRPERTVESSAPAVLAAGEEARKAGLPLIVHATGLAEARVALKAGAQLLVHGVGDLPVDQEFLDLAKKTGVVYCPTLIVPGGYLTMNEAVLGHRAIQIDDPNGCVDPATRAKIAEAPALPLPERLTAERVDTQKKRVAGLLKTGQENLKRVADAGIPIAMGTDAGNPLTLHGPSVYAEMEAMQAAGLTPMQVLIASTRGGSRAMRREKDIGTIEKGKIADLLILAADPTRDISALRRVRSVIRGGVLRSVEDLRAAIVAAK